MNVPFFDTNVLVYAFGQSDPRKPVADELLLFGGVISVQVLNEFASVARRRLQMDWDLVRLSVQQALICCPDPRPLTLQTHWQAQKICARYGLGLYDGLILASAHEAGCSVLYSEDLQHGQTIDGVQVLNPFS